MRADDFVEDIRNAPVAVAFIFLHLDRAGIFAIFVRSGANGLAQKVRARFPQLEAPVIDGIFGMDDQDQRRRHESAMARDELHLVFARASSSTYEQFDLSYTAGSKGRIRAVPVPIHPAGALAPLQYPRALESPRLPDCRTTSGRPPSFSAWRCQAIFRRKCWQFAIGCPVPNISRWTACNCPAFNLGRSATAGSGCSFLILMLTPLQGFSGPSTSLHEGSVPPSYQGLC